MKKFLAFGVSAWLITLSFATTSGVPRVLAAPAGFINQLVLGNLNLPTDFAFVKDPTTPNAGVFITLKNGQVLLLPGGASTPAQVLNMAISNGGDRGLLSIALDPQFSTNHYVYLFYTTLANHQRVSRFLWNGSFIDQSSEKVLLENPEVWGGFLNAGDLRFGPDGKLYVSMGSNGEGAIAQDLSSMDGKMLRINSDGTIPADNPFVAVQGGQPAVYATGFRNPWRFNFGPDGKAILGDVGQDTWDKVVRVQPGANYGWPNFEGDCTPNCGSITPPLFVIPHNGGGLAVAGGAFYTGTSFPGNYQNNYFFGDYVQGYLKNVVLNADGTVNQIQGFDTGDGSIAGINMGPDGCLYYIDIFPGELHKVCTAGTSQTVSAIATSDVHSGNLPLAVNFSAAQSVDGTGGTLSYSWNFGDGGTGTGISASHTYTVKGIYTATVTANSTSGKSGTATVKIWAGYSPPSPHINTPVPTLTWNAGNTINFSGSATDPQDGALGASAMSWQVIFHHNTHIHPATVFGGVTSGSFTIPTEIHTQTVDTSYEFQLTATDSAGLASATSVFINPNIVTLNIGTNPSGRAVILDSQPITTPYSSPAIPGYTRSLSVTSPQSMNGINYVFASWSNGGAQSQIFAMPVTSQTYTANFTATSTGALAFNLGASSGATTYKAGDAASITVTASANQNIGNLLIDTELWNGGKILQNIVSPVAFAANTAQNFNWNFTAPAIQGNYAIKTGIFSSDWSKLYMWNDNAATLVVGSSTATSTGPLAFTDSVSLNAATYAPGGALGATSNIQATQNLPNVLLDTEFYDASGVKVGQNVVPVNLVANQNFASVFNMIAPTNPGAYSVKLGVFQNDWSKAYFWDNAASTFTVQNSVPLSFVVNSSMSSSTFSAGATAPITTKVTATQNVANIAIDTEIYDANNSLVGQNVVSTSLAANQQYATVWNEKLPATNGTYTVKVGVFSSDYKTLYFWANRAFQFIIGNPLPPPTPGQTYPVTAIVPTDGSTVTGVTEIKSVVSGLDINSYNIGWRTGTGVFFTLDTEPVNQAYKHAWIDFSTWTWSPNSVYPIEFQATDLKNNIIGDTKISVTVQH